MSVFLELHNSITEEAGPILGPFPYAQITFNIIRVGTNEGELIDILRFEEEEGVWIKEDDPLDEGWTDVIIGSTQKQD